MAIKPPKEKTGAYQIKVSILTKPAAVVVSTPVCTRTAGQRHTALQLARKLAKDNCPEGLHPTFGHVMVSVYDEKKRRIAVVKQWSDGHNTQSEVDADDD